MSDQHSPQPHPHHASQPPGPHQTPQPPASGSGYASAPGYSPVQVKPDAPNALLILIFGILGITVAGILAPFAWYMGNKSKAQIDAAPPGTYNNVGYVTTGRIMGIIGSVIMIVLFVAFIVMFIFLIVAASASSTG